MEYDIKDIKLASLGKLKIAWTERNMPVLRLIRKKFQKEKPFKEIRISACLHVTAETAILVHTLKIGGAEVNLCASNPLSTQDEIAASLVKDFKIAVFAIRNEDNNIYYQHIEKILEQKPNITMDDGADLVSTIHQQKKELFPYIFGGTEETTTGVIRLNRMAQEGILKFPIIAVNNANTKHLFDNRYGTGQSTIDGILRATNILLAGKTFVVCGYGWCGRGVAMRAKGMGANIIIVEVDPLKALEAIMDGYVVTTLKEAAKQGDIFVTLTGNFKVIRPEHFKIMKDGVILANSGHFNVEIDIEGLKKISSKIRKARENVEEFILKNGKKIYLLGEGRLINLVSAEGHPASVMDMSFANQSLSVEFIVKNRKQLPRNVVLPVPKEIDKKIAELKLHSLKVKIDKLTKAQKKYLSTWNMGT